MGSKHSRFSPNARLRAKHDNLTPPYSSNITTAKPDVIARTENHSHYVQITVHIPTIKASDVPQWHWTQSQCREWLTVALSEYCGIGKEQASQIAAKFQGFGPNLWKMREQDWFELVGIEEGKGMFAIMKEMRGERGAIPSNVGVPHFMSVIVNE